MRCDNKAHPAFVVDHFEHRFYGQIGNGLIAVFQSTQRRIQEITAELTTGRQNADIVRDTDLFPVQILINLL